MSRFIVTYWTHTEPPWDTDVPWIVRVAVRWGITLVGIVVAEWLITGVDYDGWPSLFWAASQHPSNSAASSTITRFMTSHCYHIELCATSP